MSGLPQLDPNNPTATTLQTNILAIDPTNFLVNNPVAKKTDPLKFDFEFAIGGTSAQEIQTGLDSNGNALAGAPFPYTVEVFYESIGAPGAGTIEDEGVWGTITGLSSDGVADATHGTDMFRYEKKNVELAAPATLPAGNYKLTATVTMENIPRGSGSLYGVIEGSVIRRT